MSLSDREFVEQFQNRSLPPEYFNHLGHLRLAWLYLQHYNLLEATDKISEEILAYASSLGAPDKFDAELTADAMKLVWHTQEICHAKTFDEFIEQNQRLIFRFNDELQLRS